MSSSAGRPPLQAERLWRELELAGERLGRRFQENIAARAEVEKREGEVNRAQGLLRAEAEELRQQRARLEQTEAEASARERSLAEASAQRLGAEEDLRRRAAELQAEEERIRAALRKRAEELQAEEELLRRDLGKLTAEREKQEAQAKDLERREQELRAAEASCRANAADLGHRQESFQQRLAEQELTHKQHLEEIERFAEERRFSLAQHARSEEDIRRQSDHLQHQEQRLNVLQQELAERELAMEAQSARMRARCEGLEEEVARLKAPEQVLSRVLELVNATRVEATLTREEEQVLHDGRVLKDAVVKEQLRSVEASLAAVPGDATGREAGGGSRGTGSVSMRLDGATKGIVLALLALQGLHDAGEAKAADHCEQALAMRITKAHKLAKIRAKTPLAFALATAGACCLVWSSMRKRVEEDAKTIMNDVQDLHRWLQADASNVQGKRQKADCILKLLDVCTKSLHAWGILEGHLACQRQFANGMRQTPGASDLRMLLFASFGRAEMEASNMRKELAAMIKVCATKRVTAGGADREATGTPEKRKRRS